nr:MAG TPA: hypothetical protein [Caudoviricetes sp.]
MCKYKDYDSRLQCTDKNVGEPKSEKTVFYIPKGFREYRHSHYRRTVFRSMRD